MKKNCKGTGKLKLTDILEMNTANIIISKSVLEDGRVISLDALYAAV